MMCLTPKAIAIAALALCAAPVGAATISPEIIMTDMGFRQLADCHETWPRRVWRDGHYWSVRPTWVCVDEPYFSGKGGTLVSLEPDDDIMPWPITAFGTPPRAVGTPHTPTSFTPGGTPPWGIPPRPPQGPTPLPPIELPPAPIPLPAPLWMLALALGMIRVIKWRKT